MKSNNAMTSLIRHYSNPHRSPGRAAWHARVLRATLARVASERRASARRGRSN